MFKKLFKVFTVFVVTLAIYYSAYFGNIRGLNLTSFKQVAFIVILSAISFGGMLWFLNAITANDIRKQYEDQDNMEVIYDLDEESKKMPPGKYKAKVESVTTDKKSKVTIKAKLYDEPKSI